MGLAPGVTPGVTGHPGSRCCTLGSKFAGLGAVAVLLALGPELRLASDGERVRQGDVRVRFLRAVDSDSDSVSTSSSSRGGREVLDPVCAGWRCTCQGFSNLYLTWDWHWGAAPEAWWASHNCKTTPDTTTVSTMPPPTEGPVTSTTPAHAPPKTAAPGFVHRFVPPQLLPPPPPKRPTGSMRLAVVTEVGARGQEFTAQFVALLFESWK